MTGLGGVAHEDPSWLDARRRDLRRALDRAVRSAGLTGAAASSLAADACRLDAGGGSPEAKARLAALGDREAERIRALGRALARLDAGEYGRCAACGAAIGRARLETLPETSRCRRCAQP